MIEKKDEFVREVEKINQSVAKNGEVKYDTKIFQDEFLKQSSHSPDNIESIKHIEYGYVRVKDMQNRKQFGLKIKGKNVLLSDIIYFLENEEICKVIQKEFTELTVDEIEAAQRVITILMSGLECLEIGMDS
jgi:hypothetical protein